MCREPTAGAPTCARHELVRDVAARCRRCARRLPSEARDGSRCRRCRARAPAIAACHVAGSYTRPLSEWILAWKHRPAPALVVPLARRVIERLDELAQPGIVVPIPQHPLRRLERGADGVGALAEELAAARGARFCRALRRTRATRPQGEPGARSRASNVADVFAVTRRGRRRVPVASAWLVDDVITTGATLNEAARTLRRAGVGRVVGIAIARAENDVVQSGP